jgi:hypothetical protein
MCIGSYGRRDDGEAEAEARKVGCDHVAFCGEEMDQVAEHMGGRGKAAEEEEYR